MTYNFDPERWYLMHLAQLEKRRADGEIDDDDFRAGVADLERRYEEILRRLDGTYQIPHEPVER